MTDNMSFEKVSQEYYDVLKELGNIGAGNATTALAQMLQCKVDMKVPQVRLLNFNEVGEVMGGEEQIVAGIYLAVEGDITGSMMFILEQEAAKSLVEKLMGMPLQDGLDEMGISALKEIGNIITGAILSVPAIEFGIMGDKILLIQTQFTDEVDLNGYFILLPDLDSYAKILKALGL